MILPTHACPIREGWDHVYLKFLIRTEVGVVVVQSNLHRYIIEVELTGCHDTMSCNEWGLPQTHTQPTRTPLQGGR